jgi:hypothetical protein
VVKIEKKELIKKIKKTNIDRNIKKSLGLLKLK